MKHSSYNFPSRRGELDLTGLSFENYQPKKKRVDVLGIIGGCLVFLAIGWAFAVIAGV